MATTADYLNKLVTQKNTLADNLVTKGVTATHDETLETLVPKVLDISGGVSVEIGNRIDPKQTDLAWEILANGSSAVNGNFNIIGYNVTPMSLIYVKAKNPEAKCKFVFQNIFSVTTVVPNTAIIGNPYTTDYDGLIIVPENAKWICFSQQKTDDVTGIYEIVGGV